MLIKINGFNSYYFTLLIHLLFNVTNLANKIKFIDFSNTYCTYIIYANLHKYVCHGACFTDHFDIMMS